VGVESPIGNFEAAGDFAEWPANEAGKPTQVAVFGIFHRSRGKCCEIMYTGQFPDLEKAMYWGAKKELEAIRKKNFQMASRVLWQHDLTPEQAVAAAYKRTEKQMDRALNAAESGSSLVEALGSEKGPLRPVDYSKVQGFAVDIEYLDEE
jgi:hypothetical protein